MNKIYEIKSEKVNGVIQRVYKGENADLNFVNSNDIIEKIRSFHDKFIYNAEVKSIETVFNIPEN